MFSLPEISVVCGDSSVQQARQTQCSLNIVDGVNNPVSPENITWWDSPDPGLSIQLSNSNRTATLTGLSSGACTVHASAYGAGFLGPVGKRYSSDNIIVTAASPAIPESYIEQLANNGKLVIPVGSRWSQSLLVVQKKDNKVISRDLGGCVFVPLLGKDGWKENGNNQ